MSYQVPWRIVLASAVIGLVLDSIDFVEKATTYIFPPAPKIRESYLFLDVSQTYSKYGEKQVSELLSEIGGFFPNWTFAEVNLIEELVSEENVDVAQNLFCTSALQGASSAVIQSCLESSALEGAEVALYRVSNEGDLSTDAMNIQLNGFSGDQAGHLALDYYLYDYRVRQGCLEVNDSGDDWICIATANGRDSEVEISRGLMPGEILHVPLYIGMNFWFDDAYDGVIYFPIRVPESISVGGKTIIQTPAPMSITPTLLNGTYEIRG